MDETLGKIKARDYYDQQAGDYLKQYEEGYNRYPANLIRIKFIIERLKQNKIKTILDAGCGTCGPIIRLIKEGFDVKGFDFSQKMIEEGRAELRKVGLDPNIICVADLEDEKTLPNEKFDAILALGVFPHIPDVKKALLNMRKLLKPNGIVFIEFRNDLFSAFTLNKYSMDFFLNRLIDMNSLPQDVSDDVLGYYSEKLKVDKPIKKEDGKISYAEILAKFHNPLTINNELFNPSKFSIVHTHFYHFHALPPVFENKHPKLFRELSMKMENTLDWRGHLMASAFVIEARKID